ncbi:N-acetylmuramoyl-L-alanine amidase family protein [Clostridium prolinivorans]|uniref:N-acetylmuramoyl-L-alanine amidase family protein n=1 Tax=Clostridium prolinivorans TaxID=2769420 RepID=UPI000FDAE4EC|nr:N-acetylmuramoyl-L-alanine amidase [Clostridium prolinivorans]
MKVRVANKKLFTFWCCVFILIIINIFLSISKHVIGIKDKPANTLSTLSNNIVLTSDKNGSITLEENNYFKKITINTKNYNDTVDFEDLRDFIEINLKKDDILKLNLRGSDKEVKDIFYEKYDDNLKIKVKKNFNKNNFVYLDKSNSKKIIVLISKKENPYKNTIVLDAGHGGEDIGANVGSIYEKDITLKITDYAADELRYRGYKVVKTREDDRLLELSEIGKIANAALADLFISVHINFNEDSVYKGVSTYYYDIDGYQKEERIKLAETMQSELIKDDNWEDRGIIKENFQVLRETKMPSVLLECGFLSNQEDRRKLTDESVLKNFAKNIANGIDKYLESNKAKE